MKARTATLLCSILALSTVIACDKKESPTETSEAGASKSDAEKKETVDALLRENGIDPTTIETPKDADAKPGAAPTAPGAAPADPANAAAGDSANNSRAEVSIISAGAEPKKELRYKFEKGRTLKFTMDMTVTPKRTVNGQPMPAMPGITIGMTGTSQTMELQGGKATRLNTFTSFSPGGEGLPPMIVEQMQAQFTGLKGTQLTEVVSDAGEVLDLRVPAASAQNPQVVALLQNLQDGMTNAYLPLPPGPVGVGAKWKAVNKVQAAGVNVTQENEVTLKSMNGDKIVVELTFKQSAPPQKVQAPELPPGANVELTGMTGGGTGSMTVDLASLATESKVDLSMTVDTKVSAPGQPEPVLSSTDTGMKIHLKVTK